MNYKKIISITMIIVFLVTVNILAANSENTLKLKLEQRPIFLNPIYSSNNSELMINREIFDTLLTYNQKGELINNLTENWELNDDSTIFKFKLKEKIYFHPYKINSKEVKLAARELTAKDLKWSFEYLSSAQSKSPYSDLFKEVKGYKDYRRGKTSGIKGFRVVDKYNFSIELVDSNAAFIFNLANKAAVILTEEAVLKRKEPFSLSPIGTGPFKFENFLSNKVILTKNNNYWEKQEDKKELPYLSKLEFDFQKDQNFIKNYKDYDIYELNTEKLRLYQANNRPSDYKIKKIANNNFYVLALKYENYKLKEKLKKSIDEKSFIEELNLAQLKLLDSENNNFLKEIYDYGLSDSKTLKEPVNLDIAFNNSKENIKIANLLKQKLDSYNININKYSWTEYLNKLKNRSFSEDLFMLKINYENKFQFLEDYFHSSSDLNYYDYDNHRVNTLLDYIKITKNKENQDKAYQIIKDILAKNNLFVLVFQNSDSYLFNQKIEGLDHLKNSSFSSNFKYLDLK